MSLKYYAIIAVKEGYERFDCALGHERSYAETFLRSIGHTRHSYLREEVPSRWADSDLVICANKSGVLAQGFSLALHMAVGGKKAERAAAANSKLLALAYNDQCLIDAFSYYEGRTLLRRVIEMDDYDRADVVMEGALLPEEIAAIVASSPDLEAEPDLLTEFVIDAKTYVVEGFTPMRGCSLEVAKRLGVDLDSMPEQASFYSAKPWWQRW